MNLDLQDKTVIVTAASKGLGKATACQFATEGANVVISSRSEKELAAAAAEIKTVTGKEVFCVAADLTKAGEIENLVAQTLARFGSVQVLINNAGGPSAGNFAAMDDAAWQQAFELNLLSLIRCTRAVLPSMQAQRFGRIVNFASSSFKQPLDNLILSNTFRTALIGLAKSLATELAPANILINTLGPGRIATDRVAFLDGLRAERSGTTAEEIKRLAEGQIPLGRYGRPEEFARMAVFLGSGANTYVTGQALLVDGGLVKAL